MAVVHAGQQDSRNRAEVRCRVAHSWPNRRSGGQAGPWCRVTLLWQGRRDRNSGPGCRTSNPAVRMRPAGWGGDFQGYDGEGQMPIVTDQDGRFTLRARRDRVVHLALRGDRSLMPRSMSSLAPSNRSHERLWGGTAEVFGIDFTYHASPPGRSSGPSAMRPADPLAGVRLNPDAVGSAPRPIPRKYRLVGMPKGKGRGAGIRSSRFRIRISNLISARLPLKCRILRDWVRSRSISN